MAKAIILRGVRFSAVGVACTAVSYTVFLLVSPHLQFELANVASWAAGIGLGFVLNRFVTYRIRGRDGLPLQFGLFVVGSLGQLIVSSIGYAVLMGLLRTPSWLAFPICMVFTAAYMFAYHEAITFGHAGKTDQQRQ